jgi:hypothetical protein
MPAVKMRKLVSISGLLWRRVISSLRARRMFRVLEDGKTHAIAHHFSTGKWTQVEANDKGVNPVPRNIDGGLDTPSS